MTTTKMRTAKITVKASKLDQSHQEILVRDNDGFLEYFHAQLGQWCTLPESWEAEAKQRLSQAEHATHTVAISQYSFGRESEYTEFNLPAEGDEAREFLQEAMAKAHRRSVAPWNYGRRHETAGDVERAILDGRYDDAVRIGRADPVDY